MKRFLFSVIILGFLGFTACNLPTSSQQSSLISDANASPQAWIDAPLNQSHLDIEPYEIVFHITDGQSAVQGELSINDQVVANAINPNLSSKLVTYKYTWSPDTPGKYILAVRAQGAGGVWGNKTYAVVYVGEQTPTPSATRQATSTTTPTPTQAAGFSGFTASPYAVHFGNCTPNQVTVRSQAYDPAGITTVVLFYRMRDNNGQRTDWANTAMNAEGNNQYSRTIALSSFTSPYQSGTLDIQLVIQNQKGEMVRSQVYSEVNISACQIPLNNLKITVQPVIPLLATNTPIVIIK